MTQKSKQQSFAEKMADFFADRFSKNDLLSDILIKFSDHPLILSILTILFPFFFLNLVLEYYGIDLATRNVIFYIDVAIFFVFTTLGYLIQSSINKSEGYAFLPDFALNLFDFFSEGKSQNVVGCAEDDIPPQLPVDRLAHLEMENPNLKKSSKAIASKWQEAEPEEENK